MGRCHQRSVGTGSACLPWALLPDGANLWRACRRRILTRRHPPCGWCWPDWWEEIEAVCFARALEASRRFDPARHVPVAAFLHNQVHYALSERYKEENRFGAHCQVDAALACAPSTPEEPIAREEAPAAWPAIQALPKKDCELLKRLLLEGDSEARLGRELGMNQSTISRHKIKLLQMLRARLMSSEKNL
jgi:DNA-directed RNA polymerase specialized sigma24 family protein